MHRLIAAAVAIGLMHPALAQAQSAPRAKTPAALSAQAIDFKGAVLGSTPEEVRTLLLAAMTSWRCDRDAEAGGTGKCLAEGLTYATWPARIVVFGFIDGRLSVVTAAMGQGAFEDAVAALVAKYGAPYKTKKTTVSNLMGARLPQVVHTWVIPKGGVITAGLRTGAMDTTEVQYKSAEHIASEIVRLTNAKPDI